MGATASNERKDRRGSVNNKSRLASFGAQGGQKHGNADWGAVDPRWLAAVIVAASSQGMEVAFALSRDGGAHSLKLYDFETGERVQLWFNGDANLEAELAQVFERLGGQQA
jgi:hypothetical protein